jgi:DNA processing protein
VSDDSIYYLGFSHFLGIGPVRIKLLLSEFKTAKNAYLATVAQLKKILGEKLAEGFISFRSRFDLNKKLSELTDKKIRVVCQADNDYPSSLKNMSDPPICLYIKGDWRSYSFDNQLCIAVVGTRKPTSYGIKIAKKFASALAERGVIIVSGMALGIDTVAHRSALAEDGRTVAFLGSGVDIIYPLSNRSLYEQIVYKGGLVISEFPPGMTVKPGLFIARNRLISGLAKGVFVVEGGERSGALITARYAAEQGRSVFAPPAPLDCEMSFAPNFLIKEGAKMVTSVDDILIEYNIAATVGKVQNNVKRSLSKEEAKLVEVLGKGVSRANEISLFLNLPIENVLKTVSSLELKGLLEKNSEGYYQLI